MGGGGVSMLAGVGYAVAGGVLTATGILAPVGVPLIAAGVVTSLLGPLLVEPLVLRPSNENIRHRNK